MNNKYIAILMKKKNIEEGISIFFPDHIIAGTIEMDDEDNIEYFIDNFGNEYTFMNDVSSSFSNEDVVGYCISESELLKKYDDLTRDEALVEYFDDVTETTPISFYHYSSGELVFFNFNFNNVFQYINELKLDEKSKTVILDFKRVVKQLFENEKSLENESQNKIENNEKIETISIEISAFKNLLMLNDKELKSKMNELYDAYEKIQKQDSNEKENEILKRIDNVYDKVLSSNNISELRKICSGLEEIYMELFFSLDEQYKFSSDKAKDEIESFCYKSIDIYHDLANSSDIEKIKNTMASIRDRQKIHFSTLLMEENRKQQERAEKQKELEEVFSDDFDNKEEILFNPKEMKEFLDKRIIGQEEAKKDIISAIFMNSLADESISKNTCLLVGPTGSGKTLIAESVAKFLDLPFVNIDTTQLTMPGYVGANIEDFLGRLIESANGDIEKAESGIVMLDEIDKKGSESNGDVAGKGVLNTLLPFVQGTTYDVRYNNRKVSFDTSNLTIFMTGAFTDVAKGVSDKSSYTDSKIGFGTSQKNQNKEDIAYKKLNIEDFVKHGDFPVELVGRISNIVQLSGHTKESLRTILTDSNISVLRLETEKLKKINVEVKYSDDYLDAVAEKALKLKTGARSLKSTVEKSIKEARWEVITSNDSFKAIILNKDCVEDNLKSVLVYKDDNYITVEDLRNKEVEKTVEKVKK